VATYDPSTRLLTYACAGHPPPLVIGSAPAALAPITICASPPIGVGQRTGLRQTTVALPGRARVCFYTDGVTEARTGGELFGAERLAQALSDLERTVTASLLLERVTEATDTRRDDMAACVLEIADCDWVSEVGRAPAVPAAPAVLWEELELDRDTPSGERAEQWLLACGVPHQQAVEVIDAARAAAGQAGVALIELDLRDGGPPQVGLRRDNIARLPLAPAEPRPAVGVLG
jgi:hypothetical protein